MTTWQGRVAQEAYAALRRDRLWREYLEEGAAHSARGALHLAVLVEPYLQFLLDGKKTVESRFSTRRCAPYGQVAKGDAVLLKRASGPVVGICQIADAWFYRLSPESWKDIRNEFAVALYAMDPAFWEARRSASYATLMRVTRVSQIGPFECEKRDRRGWVVIHSGRRQLGLWGK